MVSMEESFEIPGSPSTVSIRLIDTGARRTINAPELFQPAIPGFETISMPSWSFLISNNDTHVLFDLSIRKDWRTGFPPIFDALVGKISSDPSSQFKIEAKQDVRDVLNCNHNLDVNSSSISAVIWSHHHFDHRGDIKTFPASTQLVLGPGLRNAYLPGFPTDPEGELDETDFECRTVREMATDDFDLIIGGLPAHDYFSDGSFYLLSTPGHTTGHISALARTTSTRNEDNTGPTSTFVFLGGDCAHHAGVFRPSVAVPLPDRVSLLEMSAEATREKEPAGYQIYESSQILQIHPQHSNSSPFLGADVEPLCENHTEVVESIRMMQRFDSREDVLVCIAHDATLTRCLPTFPRMLNDWRRNGWKAKCRWEFLRDFDISK